MRWWGYRGGWLIALIVSGGCSSSSHHDVVPVGIDSDASTHSHGFVPPDSGAELDAGGSERDAAVTEASFGDALAQAQDEHDARCCGQIGLTYSQQRKAVGPPAPRSGASFDAAAAAACVADTRRMKCLRAKAPLLGVESCAAVYSRGTGRIGDPCATDFECAAGDDLPRVCFAHFVDNAIKRSCTRLREVGEGKDCTGGTLDEAVVCITPLICDPDKGLCTAPAELGEPCITGPVYGDTCAEGSVCDRQDTHRCVQPKPVGDTCAALEDCEALACVAGECREPQFGLRGGHPKVQFARGRAQGTAVSRAAGAAGAWNLVTDGSSWAARAGDSIRWRRETVLAEPLRPKRGH